MSGESAPEKKTPYILAFEGPKMQELLPTSKLLSLRTKPARQKAQTI